MSIFCGKVQFVINHANLVERKEQLSPMKNIHRRLVIYAIKFNSAAAFLAIYTTVSFWWSSHAVTTAAAVVGIHCDLFYGDTDDAQI